MIHSSAVDAASINHFTFSALVISRSVLKQKQRREARGRLGDAKRGTRCFSCTDTGPSAEPVLGWVSSPGSQVEGAAGVLLLLRLQQPARERRESGAGRQDEVGRVN